MMQLIVKSYFNILFAVSASCISVFLLGIYFILRQNFNGTTDASSQRSQGTLENVDVNAIAGDDLIATQLDLAKAFIESGKEQFARKILQNIIEDGSDQQQRQARTLLTQL